MFRLLLMLLALPFLLLPAPAAHAQTPPADPPLIIGTGGSLWAWDESGDPRPLVEGRFAHLPSISPLDNTLAYMAYADISMQALESQGGIGGGELPGDIWTFNPQTGEMRLIAGQPQDAAFFAPDGRPDNAIIRSTPVWSPDGSRLAWTELTYPGGVDRVVVHDFALDSTSIIVDQLPPQTGVPTPVEIQWGAMGILLRSTESFDYDTYLLYSPQGETLSRVQLGDANQFVVAALFLFDGSGREWLGVLYNTDLWQIIDPLTGENALVDGTPEAVSAQNPDTSLRVRLIPSSETDYTWQALYPDGTLAAQWLSRGFFLPTFALAPSGQAVAYTAFNPATGVYEPDGMVWRAGVTVTIPRAVNEDFALNFAWGALRWQINPAGSDSTAGAQSQQAASACPDNLPPRLIAGQSGRNISGSPNNMRAEARTSAERLTQIPDGATFVVLGGPVCGEGYTWWQVDYNGVVGWTVEGSGSEYWLEPLGQ